MMQLLMQPHIDSVGEFLANYISSTDPTVDGLYNSSSNILTIKPIVTR